MPLKLRSLIKRVLGYHDYDIRHRRIVRTIEGEYYVLQCKHCGRVLTVPLDTDLYRLPKDCLIGCKKFFSFDNIRKLWQYYVRQL